MKFGAKNRRNREKDYEYMFEDQIEFIKTPVINDEKYEDKMMDKKAEYTGKSAAQKLQDDRKTLPIHCYRMTANVLFKICNNTHNLHGWAQVPDDLLFLLVERVVGLSTYIRFGAVCQSWHSLVSTSKCSYKPMPWLMLSEAMDSDLRQFYDLSTHEIYELPLPQAHGRKILGCSYGWLVTIGEDGEFHLLNPLTAIQITLPPISTFQSLKDFPCKYVPQRVRGFFAHKATLSCDPSTNYDDVVVMLVNQGYDTTCLSYCRLSSSEWRNFPRIRQRHISYAANKFYSITWSGTVSTCVINPEPKMETIAQLPRSAFHPTYFYTVECGGELLFILSRKDHTYCKIKRFLYCTTLFKVYKLNLEDGSWVETNNIGDFAIFVGNNNAICLPPPSNIKAYKKNSIYFTCDDRMQWIFKSAKDGGYDMGVFNLDNESIDGLKYLSMSNVKYSLPIWIIPNLLEPTEPRIRARKRRCMQTHPPLYNQPRHQSGNT